MGEIAYTCGWCHRSTTGRVVHFHFPYQQPNDPENEVFVTAACSQCHRTTQFTFEFWGDANDDELDAIPMYSAAEPEGALYWRKRLVLGGDQHVPVIFAKPRMQYPSLTKPAPRGIVDRATVSAWNSAEKADADAPIKGMAYRQVLESAVKALEAKLGDVGAATPLGSRVKTLIAKNALPNHLPELIDKARGLGNRAAHEFDDFDDNDVAIIRELCEAVLRQCFTIPALVQQAEDLIEKKKAVSAGKAAIRKALEEAVPVNPAKNPDSTSSKS